jgi:hypothetical protein
MDQPRCCLPELTVLCYPTSMLASGLRRTCSFMKQGPAALALTVMLLAVALICASGLPVARVGAFHARLRVLASCRVACGAVDGRNLLSDAARDPSLLAPAPIGPRVIQHRPSQCNGKLPAAHATSYLHGPALEAVAFSEYADPEAPIAGHRDPLSPLPPRDKSNSPRDGPAAQRS